MKASALIDAIAAQIEAIEPADTQSAVDRFARVKGRQSDDELTGRRLFALRWTSPLPTTPPTQGVSCSRYVAGLELVGGYADTAAGQGRCGDDAQSITDAIQGLPRTIPAADIINTSTIQSSADSVTEGAIIASYQFEIEFSGS